MKDSKILLCYRKYCGWGRRLSQTLLNLRPNVLQDHLFDLWMARWKSMLFIIQCYGRNLLDIWKLSKSDGSPMRWESSTYWMLLAAWRRSPNTNFTGEDFTPRVLRPCNWSQPQSQLFEILTHSPSTQWSFPGSPISLNPLRYKAPILSAVAFRILVTVDTGAMLVPKFWKKTPLTSGHRLTIQWGDR